MLFDEGFKPEEVNIDKQIYWQIFPEYKGMEVNRKRKFSYDDDSDEESVDLDAENQELQIHQN